MAKNIYFDYAAATPIDPRVLKAMEPYFAKYFHNPSATYLAGRATKQAMEEARKKVAFWLGARPGEIYFTAGATEANNLAIQGLMRKFPKSEVLVSSIEHDSVLGPARLFKNKEISVSKQGILDLEALRKSLTNNTVLISIMLINNELGTIQPLREIASLAIEERKRRQKAGNKTPLYLHTDAAQAGSLLDLHISRLGVDMMSINGGKIYGPKQSGALYVRAGIEIEPLIVGGGQEMGMRSGTENVAAIVGLASSLDIAQKGRASELEKLKKLRSYFIGLLKEQIPSAVINGSDKHQSPHILHVTFPGQDNELLMMQLDEDGIECAVGSACSAGNGEPSHVCSAIGLTDELARASLRFSFGRETQKKDIQRTMRALRGILR